MCIMAGGKTPGLGILTKLLPCASFPRNIHERLNKKIYHPKKPYLIKASWKLQLDSPVQHYAQNYFSLIYLPKIVKKFNYKVFF